MLYKREIQNGFTLIEMLITLAIIAILAAMAGPSFQDFFDKGRLKRATIEVQGFIAKAKAEAVIRDTDLSISITAGISDLWCVGYAIAPGCVCTLTDPATLNACSVPVAGVPVLQTIVGAEFPDVTVMENFGASTLTFDSVRGLPSSGGTISLTSGDWDLGVVVGPLAGRVRICSPDENLGYPPC